MRKAKIVCTIGPASDSPELLGHLIESGMDVARLNFSHGSHESHSRAIKALREAAGRRRAPVAIIQDLQGPRIRIGTIPDGGIDVAADQRVRLLTVFLRSGGQSGAQSVAPASAIDIPVTYQYLARDVQPGARILIDDGLVELTVNRITGGAVECTVITGGRITSHKGINLPGTRVSVPTLTDKDREDLRFGVAQGVDYVALSFVRGPDDVVAAQKLIAECGGDVPVIAKIERPEAVHSLGGILDQADGVMIARGDLGAQMGPEAVPVLQKKIITEANRRRRLVITATQMLESMTQNPRPTRAEASDVANAVFDGSDALMLSAETAAGAYPIEAVEMMDRIIREAESSDSRMLRPQPAQFNIAETAAELICHASEELQMKVIAVFTETGSTGRLISKHRPRRPIIAFSTIQETRRRLSLYWGVVPRTIAQVHNIEELVLLTEKRLLEEKLVKRGDVVGIVAGEPLFVRGT